MIRQHKNWIVTPGVVPVGKITQVTVEPADTWRLCQGDAEYDLYIMPLEYLANWQTDPGNFAPDFVLRGEQGVLRFEYCFEHECEYRILIYAHGTALWYETYGEKAWIDNHNAQANLALYAARGDLYALMPLKCDFHIHTLLSDGSNSPEYVAAEYRGDGFDCISISDHEKITPSIEAADAYREVRLGLHLMHGEEVWVFKDMLNVGGRESVSQFYFAHKEQSDREIAELKAGLPASEYNGIYAPCLWAAGKIREFGGLAVLVHPFWTLVPYYIPAEALKHMLAQGFFDAFEVISGSSVTEKNLCTALYQELRAEGVKIPIIGNSDAHNTCGVVGVRALEGRLFTVLFARENTTEAVQEAIRAGRTAAVQYSTVNRNDDDEYQVYGEYRYVKFTRYLLDHYFSARADLMRLEGTLMHRYLQEEASGEGVSCAEQLCVCAGNAERFYKQFYGLEPRALPSDQRLSITRKWHGITEEQLLYYI